MDLDAFDGAHDEYGQVCDRESGFDLGHEVGVAGGVDDVDLAVLEQERGQGQRDRYLPLELFWLEIADRRPILCPTRSGQHAASHEQRLGKGCLAGAAMSDERDVADFRGRHGVHVGTSLPATGFTGVTGRQALR